MQTRLTIRIQLRRTVFLAIAVTGIAAADTQSGTVKSGGQNIPGASVIVDCGGNRITSVTDASGSFEIGGLPSTPCKFSIAMFGFEPIGRDVTPSATPLTFDLTLQRRAT